MKTKTKRVQTVKLAGQRYVILPEAEYRRLTIDDIEEPALPRSNVHGNYPALESMQVLIARDIIRDRRRLGLTQVELAKRASIRAETLNRIERGERSPNMATIEKIDRALAKAEAEDAG